VTTQPTGVYVHHPLTLEHDTGGHPENAERIRAMERALAAREWLGLERADAPAAGREQLLRVHTPALVDSIAELSARGGGMIDVDTVMSERSYEAVLRAAGGAAWAAEQLLERRFEFAFCGLRPPGHHAESWRAMGFCLFNSVAVAVAHAIAELGVQRVLILDWDVHHGNGTAEIFESSNQVLYVSIHQSPLYPGTGAIEEVGAGAGIGWTVNLPVAPGSGPELFRSLVDHIAVPLIREIQPQLVAISAGYDAHRADPLAECELDEAAYGGMASSVRAAAADVGAPVLVCLEGGYDLGALSGSVLATIEALVDGAPPAPVARPPAEPYIESVRRYWPQV
jgi:acetoin utilization deacetylase AcuC-like enzyme